MFLVAFCSAASATVSLVIWLMPICAIGLMCKIDIITNIATLPAIPAE
ncbi:MAG TPA: hypothetical protein VMD53_04315 [Rhizomicrobium sp.]|nr:hypothetical protein [Rhizomicrobium sp.]